MNHGTCKNSIFVHCYDNNPDCSNCGWNPKVSAMRAEKIRKKMLAEHIESSEAKRIAKIVAEAKK